MFKNKPTNNLGQVGKIVEYKYFRHLRHATPKNTQLRTFIQTRRHPSIHVCARFTKLKTYNNKGRTITFLHVRPDILTVSLSHTHAHKHYNSSLVLFCSPSVCLPFFNHLLNTAIGSMFQCLWKEMGVWWAKKSLA